MALAFTESFDMYGAAADFSAVRGWTINGTVTFNAASGRFGGGALNVANNTSNSFIAALPTTVDATTGSGTVHFAFWLKLARPSAGTYTAFTLKSSASGANLNGTFNAAGDFIMNASGFFTSTTAAALITDTNWHHMEVIWHQHSLSGGTLKVYCDGVLTSINQTNADTGNGNFAAIDQFIVLGGSNSAGSTVDDLVIWDEVGTDFVPAQLNEHRLMAVLPNGNSTPLQFTPDSGNNYARVSESGMHDSDTSYVQSTTIGQEDLYTVAALPSVPTSIFAVAIHTRAEKTDVGSVTMKNHVKSGATDTAGSGKSLTNGYKQYSDYFGKNPTTTVAWTTSDVANMKIGIEYNA